MSNEKLVSVGQFLESASNRELLAVAFELYKRLRIDIGKSGWADAALEQAYLNQIFGITSEDQRALLGMIGLKIIDKS